MNYIRFLIWLFLIKKVTKEMSDISDLYKMMIDTLQGKNQKEED